MDAHLKTLHGGVESISEENIEYQDCVSWRNVLEENVMNTKYLIK